MSPASPPLKEKTVPRDRISALEQEVQDLKDKLRTIEYRMEQWQKLEKRLNKVCPP